MKFTLCVVVLIGLITVIADARRGNGRGQRPRPLKQLLKGLNEKQKQCFMETCGEPNEIIKAIKTDMVKCMQVCIGNDETWQKKMKCAKECRKNNEVFKKAKSCSENCKKNPEE